MSNTHTLPDDPVFAFTPSYHLPGEPQQIRIVFEGIHECSPRRVVALCHACSLQQPCGSFAALRPGPRRTSAGRESRRP